MGGSSEEMTSNESDQNSMADRFEDFEEEVLR